MLELREVFEMATREVEPDVDMRREQEKRHRRSARNRKVGAFVIAAAIGLALVVFVATDRTRPDQDRAATVPSASPATEMPQPFTGGTMLLPESLEGGTFYFVSPDRTQIVMNTCCGTPNPVSVADIDGTDVRQVTRDGVDAFAARWSPDGSSLVYQGRDGLTNEIGNIYILDIATGKTRRITDLEPASYGGWSMHPSFSADGETVIFHMPRGPDTVEQAHDLWSVPSAGGKPALLVPNATGGAYSPDGGTLAYVTSVSEPSGAASLMLANVDGSDPRVLVDGARIESPRWSPDGTRIAYSAHSEGDRDYVIDVATGETWLVTGGAGVLDWFDNDTLLVAPRR